MSKRGRRERQKLPYAQAKALQDFKKRRSLWSFVAAIFVWFLLLPVNAILAPIAAVVTVIAMYWFFTYRQQQKVRAQQGGRRPPDPVRRP